MASRHIRTERFISFAKRFQITKPGEAVGRCLSTSLDFALAAKRRLGIDVQLVKWHVVGDPNYVDHWAVLLDRNTVIDLTRVQVDGKCRLVNPMADYPKTYVMRRVYPASLLLDSYAESQAQGSARLSKQFLWACGTGLLRFDLAAARRDRDAGVAMFALGEGARFINCFLWGCLTRALTRRANQLLTRMGTRPDVEPRSPNRTCWREQMLLEEPPRGAAATALLAGKLWTVGTFTSAANSHMYSMCVSILACA